MNCISHRALAMLLALALGAASAMPCHAGDEPYSRRTYRLGATMSETVAVPYPDAKDWPGGKLLLSSEHPFPGSPPSIINVGPWADAGVIKGQFQYHSASLGWWSAGLWLGDEWNRTSFYFYKPDDLAEPVLFYIETTGRSDAFERIKTLFAEAQGSPTSVSSEPVQNRMGATFQNETVEYRNATSSIILEKYGEDLDTGSLVHIYWPVYNALKMKLDEADREAASRL